MSALSDKVVGLSKPYLGPATESFLARQCSTHLKIDIATLGSSHLPDLAKWVENSGSLIMDAAKAAELAKKILAS
jgi:hypothetical protein